jgi:hypothetical protein
MQPPPDSQLTLPCTQKKQVVRVQHGPQTSKAGRSGKQLVAAFSLTLLLLAAARALASLDFCKE